MKQSPIGSSSILPTPVTQLPGSPHAETQAAIGKSTFPEHLQLMITQWTTPQWTTPQLTTPQWMSPANMVIAGNASQSSQATGKRVAEQSRSLSPGLPPATIYPPLPRTGDRAEHPPSQVANTEDSESISPGLRQAAATRESDDSAALAKTHREKTQKIGAHAGTVMAEEIHPQSSLAGAELSPAPTASPVTPIAQVPSSESSVSYITVGHPATQDSTSSGLVAGKAALLAALPALPGAIRRSERVSSPTTQILAGSAVASSPIRPALSPAAFSPAASSPAASSPTASQDSKAPAPPGFAASALLWSNAARAGAPQRATPVQETAEPSPAGGVAPTGKPLFPPAGVLAAENSIDPGEKSKRNTSPELSSPVASALSGTPPSAGGTDRHVSFTVAAKGILEENMPASGTHPGRVSAVNASRETQVPVSTALAGVSTVLAGKDQGDHDKLRPHTAGASPQSTISEPVRTSANAFPAPSMAAPEIRSPGQHTVLGMAPALVAPSAFHDEIHQPATSLTSVSPALQAPQEPAGGGSLFAHLDSTSSESRLNLPDMANTLKVNIADGGNGAVGVQAHFTGGQVSASIEVDREPSLHLLTGQLPAIEQFLSATHVDVKSVSVDLSQSGSRQPAHSEGNDDRKPTSQVRESRAAPRAVAAVSSTRAVVASERLLSVKA